MDHVKRTLSADQRAVSEMVGWIIVVGLIVSSISIVYFNGVPALNNEREAQKASSVVSGFELLQANVEHIAEDRAASRGTQLNLVGDEINLVNDPGTLVDVNVTRPDGKRVCPENVCNTTMTPIRFLTTDNAIVYENGAVIRRSGDLTPSGMTSQPSWLLTNETLIVPVIATRGKGSVAGSDTVSVFTEQAAENSLVMRNESGLNVTVNVTTRRPIAWRTFGTEYGDVTVDESKGRVSIRVEDVRKVIHDKTVVEVSFI